MPTNNVYPDWARRAIKDFLTKDIAAAKAAGLHGQRTASATSASPGDLAWHAGHPPR